MPHVATRINRKPAASFFIAGFAILAMTLSSCSPGSVESAAPQQGERLRLEGSNSDAWIVHMGEQSLFTMWISPDIETAPGQAFRFLTMVGHLPGSAHPFFGQQTQVQARTDREISSSDQSGLYSLSIRPNPGLMWGDVQSQADCQVELEGFF